MQVNLLEKDVCDQMIKHLMNEGRTLAATMLSTCITGSNSNKLSYNNPTAGLSVVGSFRTRFHGGNTI